ncbi:hypothetical protein OSB04_006970 [Centaurea solstitialis]|uniref:No apical meristem-associated C-terminal domain-containing protein n=1 Tax=Centaurea solstitialis TaxID=347529 RepID=A0AA38TIY6_9ASTR|nr:hypothetical protein OSB04_006970 [Centaurea solstitialis]
MDPYGTPSGSRRTNPNQPNQPNQPYHQPYNLPNLSYHPPNVSSDYWMYAHFLAQQQPPPPPPSQHSGFHQPTGSHQATGSHQNPTTGWWALRDEQYPSDDDDDELVPETQPFSSPSPPPPPPPQKNKRGRKGKSAVTEAEPSETHTTKAKCKPWTLNEEVELAKAWVEVTEDPAIGNYQKRVDNYWTSIKASFDKRMNYDPKVRSGDALPSKVRTLISSVSKFACVYNNVSNSRGSGENDIMLLDRAKDRYHRETGKSFPYEHAWRVVKGSPKFDPVVLMDPRNICAPKNKRSRTTNESDARSNFVNLDTDSPSNPERTRPMGRNAARRAASSSTATASSEAVSMVATELGSLTTTNNRLIDAISQRQRSIDYKIYMKPHRHLEGLELEAALEEKERLRETWGSLIAAYQHLISGLSASYKRLISIL